MSRNSPVVLGYMIMLSVWFAYVGFLFALHQNLFPVIVRWLFLGVHFVAVKSPCLLWVFSVKSCKRLQSLVGFGIRQASLPAIFHWLSLGFHFITVRLPSFLWVSSEMVCKSFQSLVRLRIISIHRQATLPAIFQWFSIGFHFITVTLPRFLWVSLAVACVILSVLKEAFVLCFKIGVLPWIIGCWLGICTSPLFGTLFSQSSETVSHFPCMMILRWSSGIVCLLVAESCMNRIQKVISLNFCFIQQRNLNSLIRFFLIFFFFLADCSYTSHLVSLRCYRSRLQDHQNEFWSHFLCGCLSWTVVGDSVPLTY